MNLGKLPPKFDARTLDFISYVTPQLPAPPDSVDYYRAVKKWPVMLNDTTADCAIAAAGHMIQAWTANNQREQIILDPEILNAYKYFVGDNLKAFIYLLDVLSYWRNTGIGGHRILGYTMLEPKSQIQAEDSINLFGSCYIGLALPNFASPAGKTSSELSSIAWQVPSQGVSGEDNVPNPKNGHCVPAVGYDQRNLWVVTWGTLKPMSWGFYQAYMDETYAVLSQDWINSSLGKSPSGFDLGALLEDLDEINGPSREDVKPAVISVLNQNLPPKTPKIPPTLSGEKLDLQIDCNMSSQLRRGLAPDLTEISTAYPKGLAISPQETEKLKTVANAIDLTWSMAKGQTALPGGVGILGKKTHKSAPKQA